MNRAEIEEKVKYFLTEELEIDGDLVKPENRLKEDMGVESLDLVDIVVFIEKYFGFRVKPADMKEVSTLSQFYDFIEKNLS